MDKFKERFRRYMVGRYGMDQLGRFLTGVVLALCIADLLVRSHWISSLLNLLTLVVLVILYLRIFSRNIGKRYRENEIYLRYSFYVTELWKKLKFRFQEWRKYHIFKCPGCGQKVRIPRGHGKVSIHCPKCGRDFIRKS